MSLNEIVKTMQDAVNRQTDQAKPGGYDTTATVRRIEGDTAFVHIPGGVDETPVKLTINAKAGDNVQVRVSGGNAFLVGNGSAPPTDDARANQAYTVATVAEGAAQNALANAARAAEAADSAQASATRAEGAANDAVIAAGDAQTAAGNAQTAADTALVNLATVEDVVGVLNWITEHGTMTLTSDVTVNPAHVYFIVDPAGDYVVGGTHYSIVSDPKDADLSTYYELTVDESVQNYVATHIVVDSEGLWIIPDAGGNKVLIAVGGIGHTYPTAGTYIVGKVNGVDAVLAEFTANGATIGQSGKTRLDMDYHSMQMVDSNNNSYFYVSDLRDQSGTGQVVDKFYSDGTTTIYQLSAVATDTNYTVTVSDGSGGTITKQTTHVLFQTPVTKYEQITVTYDSASEKLKAYTIGIRYPASDIGLMSTSEGYNNKATQYASHAEGWNTEAISICAHSEGEFSSTSGRASHVEGMECGINEKGIGAHAEGVRAVANGIAAHSEGMSSQSWADYAHSEGYNTYAKGEMSHAQNEETYTNKRAQTALGTFNIKDTSATTTHPSGTADYGKYAAIIGNGTADNARSNALTVDWSGNVEAAGDVTDGSGNVLANKQDKFEEDTWHNITLSGVTSKGTNQYRKMNGYIEVYVCFSMSGAHTSYTAASTALPTGYRPKAPVQLLGASNTTITVEAHIDPDGVIKYYNSAATGAWLTGHAVYSPA